MIDAGPDPAPARLAVGMGTYRVDRRLRLELRGRGARQRPSVEPLSHETPRLALDAASDLRVILRTNLAMTPSSFVEAPFGVGRHPDDESGERDDVDADRFRIREIRVRHASPHVRALWCRRLMSARQTMHARMGASSISAWRAACSIACSHGAHTDQAVPAFPAFSTMMPRQRLQRRRRPAVRSRSATASRTVRASVAIVSARRRGRRRRAR